MFVVCFNMKEEAGNKPPIFLLCCQLHKFWPCQRNCDPGMKGSFSLSTRRRNHSNKQRITISKFDALNIDKNQLASCLLVLVHSFIIKLDFFCRVYSPMKVIYFFSKLCFCKHCCDEMEVNKSRLIWFDPSVFLLFWIDEYHVNI